MNFKKELIDRLEMEIKMIKQMDSDDHLINSNCPSAFGMTDWKYNDDECDGTCEECWRLNFEQ